MPTFPAKINYAAGNVLTAAQMVDIGNGLNDLLPDAKGSLTTVSAANTPAQLTVGSDGSTLVADSSTSTGLRYNPLVNQNFAVNGGFDIWQRGTSFTGISPFYTADRWQGYREGAVAGATFSRQTASLDGFQYCLRALRDSGNTNTNTINVAQSFETNDARKFHGQYATISFWARKGATFSGANDLMTVILQIGSGTETAITAGFTGGVNTIETTRTLTTSWQRFTVTTSGTITNLATQMAILFRYSPTGTAGATDYFEITGVQFEVGQVSTAWKRAGNTIAGELQAAQRYYYRNSGQAYTNQGFGFADTTTSAVFDVSTPVTMRSSTPIISQGNLEIALYGTGTYAFTALGLLASSGGSNKFILSATGATGLTQNRPYALRNANNTSGFVALEAEL